MKHIIILFTLIFVFGTNIRGNKETRSAIEGYYTRLPFNDSGFTGKFADIVIDLSGKGQFIFSREYSYQPYWVPAGGKRFLVDRLIPRTGDGPKERPDKNNICSNVAIVEKSNELIKIHWRYAPDMTKPSFINFREAYNNAGNVSGFYAEYADEYFTVNSNGSVIREVKKGCYSLDDWNDPQNQIVQKFTLTPTGIKQTSYTPAKLQSTYGKPIKGEIVKEAAIAGSALDFRFDEALTKNKQLTKESITNTDCIVQGVKAYWGKGVSGMCLSFDSYSNAVAFPSSKCPVIANGLTIQAWIAPQEYPFNQAAILDHLSGVKGYFLGIDAKGCIRFRLGVNDSILEASTLPVPVYKWTFITATFDGKRGLSIYFNGELVVFKSLTGEISDAENTDMYIGMTHSFRQYPAGGERLTTKNFSTNMVFSGLIDEVNVYTRELSKEEVGMNYKLMKPKTNQSLQAWSLPDGPINKSVGFGAQYSCLKYSPQWDGLWRVGKFADITVTFDNVPWRYVFWRGTRYLPSLVTDYGSKSIWSSDQGPESFNGQCHEHMSDMLCRYSNVRIISSTDARVIVHWRNSSASIAYEWPMTDANGWGIWTDEYWTIYPDGVAVRHQVVNNNTSATINCEMNQNEILHQPRQTTDDVLLDNAVIVANTDGNTQTWYRSKKEPSNDLQGERNLQFTNLNSKTKQFEIGEIGTWVQTFLEKDVYWVGWNHYPVQLIPSDGTVIYQYDRPASTCPTTLHEVRRIIDKKTMEALDIYGLTNSSPDSLTRLNRSWNYAPKIKDEIGCTSLGYMKSEKAYYFSKNADKMYFNIAATKEMPLENPSLVFKNWGKKNVKKIVVKINGRIMSDNAGLKKGIELDTDGIPMLVIWLKFSSEKSINMAIESNLSP